MEIRNEKSETNLIYGTRAVMEAVRAGKEIEKLYIQQDLNNPLMSDLKKLLAQNNISIQYVPLPKLQRLTRGNHQGVVAFLSLVSYQKAEDVVQQVFDRGEVPLFIMLDRITDVRNFGAIVRSAACAGVHAVIIPAQGAAQINPDAIKTSAGGMFEVAICKEQNLKLTIEYLKASGLHIFAATEKANKFCYEINLTEPCCILLGSEEDGISSEYLKRADEKIKIPISGKISSYNVSVSAGIVLYEVLRQRSKGV